MAFFYIQAPRLHGKRSRREVVEEGEDLTEEEVEAASKLPTEIVEQDDVIEIDLEDVGVEKVIQVVSSGDLTFAIKENSGEAIDEEEFPPVTQSWAGEQGYICMSTPAFAATLVILLAILVSARGRRNKTSTQSSRSHFVYRSSLASSRPSSA